MITVSVLINGKHLTSISARNTGKTDKADRVIYETSVGKNIVHNRDDGAITLAQKMMDIIEHEQIERAREMTISMFDCDVCGKEGFNIICDVCHKQFCKECWKRHKADVHQKG